MNFLLITKIRYLSKIFPKGEPEALDLSHCLEMRLCVCGEIHFCYRFAQVIKETKVSSTTPRVLKLLHVKTFPHRALLSLSWSEKHPPLSAQAISESTVKTMLKSARFLQLDRIFAFFADCFVVVCFDARAVRCTRRRAVRRWPACRAHTRPRLPAASYRPWSRRSPSTFPPPTSPSTSAAVASWRYLPAIPLAGPPAPNPLNNPTSTTGTTRPLSQQVKLFFNYLISYQILSMFFIFKSERNARY